MSNALCLVGSEKIGFVFCLHLYDALSQVKEVAVKKSPKINHLNLQRSYDNFSQCIFIDHARDEIR